jgi:UDP-3-O-[3-hydroxymyristoyl] glucosamine N-acyltransferase
VTEVKTYTLFELSQITSGTLKGDPNAIVSGIADLKQASATDVSFLSNHKYQHLLDTTKAGLICLKDDVVPPPQLNTLVCEDPSLTFQKIAELFLEDSLAPRTAFSGIHETAVIHPTAEIAENVEIGPYAVIDAKVKIGSSTKIGSHVYIGPQVEIAEDCLIYSSVSIREGCSIGNRVILHAGVVIGSCGFGYSSNAEGKHSKLRHLAGVVIEDDVEIGANTTVDRGRLNDTRVARGTKVDNLVIIAHGVQVGEDNIIVAQTGIAGSSKTGKRVIIGGQVAVNGHITLADDVMLAGRAAVVKSIDKAGKYAGTPAIPFKECVRDIILLSRISDYTKRLKALEKKLKSLESKASKV